MSVRKRSRSDIESNEAPMSSAEVRAIVTNIVETSGTTAEKKARFEREYPQFAAEMPMLFEMACGSNFDQARFDYFMRLRDSVQSGSRTIESASKEIGEEMFNVYVKDKVPSKK